MRPALFDHPRLDEHALLDSGEGEKLERFGPVVLARPDPQALWRRRLPEAAWRAADLRFVRESDRGGRWEARRGAHPAGRGPRAEWDVRVQGATLRIRPTPFKHVGLFPEQAANWERVRAARARLGGRPALLNLFGYTGAASVLAALDGWDVTHVDASRASLAWARENAALSGLGSDGLRVVLEDALAFARREARRGRRYEALLVDPPQHGRGPKGERWRFERDLAPLLEACAELVAERAVLVLSCYAVGWSPLALATMLDELAAARGGEVEAGELALPEEPADGAGPPRRLSCGFCARWSRGL